MAIEMKDVLKALDPDEPNYAQAAKLGTAALPHLEILIKGHDVNLASKSTYLAGMIQDQRSLTLLEEAAAHPDPRVRIAAAATVRNLAQFDVNKILQRLVRDPDLGVRRQALKSVRSNSPLELRRSIEALTRTEPDPNIRSLATETLRRLPP